MGCDIHVHAEKRDGSRWVRVEVPRIKHGDYNDKAFESRQYGKFGWLAGVRNYSAVEPVAAPRGFPKDASDEVKEDFESWDFGAHTPSWLTVSELEAYDYDQSIEDRRTTVQTSPNSWDGGRTADRGKGERMTLREFLISTDFFESLEAAKSAGAERIVFWFDN